MTAKDAIYDLSFSECSEDAVYHDIKTEQLSHYARKMRNYEGIDKKFTETVLDVASISEFNEELLDVPIQLKLF